jgi:hypothetical protein
MFIFTEMGRQIAHNVVGDAADCIDRFVCVD